MQNTKQKSSESKILDSTPDQQHPPKQATGKLIEPKYSPISLLFGSISNEKRRQRDAYAVCKQPLIIKIEFLRTRGHMHISDDFGIKSMKCLCNFHTENCTTIGFKKIGIEKDENCTDDHHSAVDYVIGKTKKIFIFLVLRCMRCMLSKTGKYRSSVNYS